MAGTKLSNLTERELLVLLLEKVDRLEKDVATGPVVTERVFKLEMQLAELKVRFNIYVALIGSAAGAAGSLIAKIIHF